MFATRSELLEKIRLGEGNFLELKELRLAGGRIRGPTQDDLADELAAFANSRGGGCCSWGCATRRAKCWGYRSIDSMRRKLWFGRLVKIP